MDESSITVMSGTSLQPFAFESSLGVQTYVNSNLTYNFIIFHVISVIHSWSILVHPSSLGRSHVRMTFAWPSHVVHMSFACCDRLPARWPPTSAAPNRLWPSWCSRNWLAVLATSNIQEPRLPRLPRLPRPWGSMANWKLNLHFDT